VALLSVVVPAFNEQQVLPAFFARLKSVLATLPDAAEIVFVNDGSTDATASLLDAWAAEDSRVRVLHFTRNFGHQAALTAGIDHARGDAVVLIDADLQDPPELIPTFHARWREGAQVVFGQRRRTNEGVWKRVVYHAFYRLLHALADIDIPLDSGDFSLMDRALVDRLRALPERTRFLRGLRSWVGCARRPWSTSGPRARAETPSTPSPSCSSWPSTASCPSRRRRCGSRCCWGCSSRSPGSC
jgi:dolichol-phosphate mannosyltransferase